MHLVSQSHVKSILFVLKKIDWQSLKTRTFYWLLFVLTSMTNWQVIKCSILASSWNIFIFFLGKHKKYLDKKGDLTTLRIRDWLKFGQQMRDYFGVFVRNSANRTVMSHVKEDYNASVNSTCVQLPPWQPRGICQPCQSRGRGFIYLARPGGQALANPGRIPRAFDTHVVNFKTWSTWRISEIKISSLWRIGLSSEG